MIAEFGAVRFTRLAVIWSLARAVVVRRLPVTVFMMTIDQIVARLKIKIPGVQVSQLSVAHPAVDDDGLWFIRIPGRAAEVQLESSQGGCPLLIESDFSAERFLWRA